ncbi:hypothetical protein M5X00_26405 [Paenibacillus alvei]|uniref:hypothetical protein n=1 Tax=Paenibacillus alvei TaxID=44250 RepID=UPI000289D56F|nr:hypothetical protein [Paenibacillus alvei]EJW14065.1 hypothetical protein PAV_141p01710 [Paenibacillus alvei DSM 29]MCY9544883.1 hypothetical protein [Paenibacillus alvei]MCY9707784.1 hypothetical protein [Paenibacillus alvei]MCY9757765.1 hypothetical protein [Paenibacillus alvei]MEC0082704.1 hypothetical protein [Paenibacillus alvei]
MAKQIDREIKITISERETYSYETKEEASQHDIFMIAAGWLRIDQYEYEGTFYQIFTKGIEYDRDKNKTESRFL